MTVQSAMQEQLARSARAGQETVTAATRTWGETLRFVSGMPAGGSAGPSPQRLVDAWFDVADEALAAQRQLATLLLHVGDPALNAMARTAHRAVAVTRRYTDAATAGPTAGPDGDGSVR
jgi:hypothetical protein